MAAGFQLTGPKAKQTVAAPIASPAPRDPSLGTSPSVSHSRMGCTDGYFLCLCLDLPLRLSGAVQTHGVSAFSRGGGAVQGCARSPAPPSFGEAKAEKLLSSPVSSALLSARLHCGAAVTQCLQARHSCYIQFDTPCGLNGFPRLQLQHSHHFLLAAGAGNPPLPSSSPLHRYHIFLMHLSPISSRHLLLIWQEI